MRRITHTVRCSGHNHEVWRDERGCLHRTCNGEGCTLGLESARALLSGHPDIERRVGSWKERYSAASWGPDWRDAKFAAWGLRRKRESPLVLKEATRDAFDVKLHVNTWSRTFLACQDELLSADYRQGQSHYIDTSPQVTVALGPAFVTTPSIVGEVKIRPHPRKVQWRARFVHLHLCADLRKMLELRIALGGTMLFRDGERRYAAAGIVERRDGGLVVVAGRQAPGRSLEVLCRPALVRREGPHAVLVRWLSWQEMPEEIVARYVGSLWSTRDLVSLDATLGREAHRDARIKSVGFMYQNLIAARHTCEDRQRALAQYPPADAVDAAFQQAFNDAVEYVRSWGGLALSCPRACDVAAAAYRSGINVIRLNGGCPEHQDCPAIVGVLAARKCLFDQARDMRLLKNAKKELAEVTRALRRRGFVVNAAGQLVELPVPREKARG